MKVLIVSDIHANPWALESVLDDAGPVDQVLCAGDLVNYGPNPAAAVALLRKSQAIIVSGNHDYAVACATDPRASPAKQPLAMSMCEWTRRQLTSDDLDWLAAIDTQVEWSAGTTLFHLVHATPINPRYDYRLTPAASDELVKELIGDVAADVLVLGHTHLPLLRRFGNLQIVNPGSVGQPLDGDPRAAYALWHDGTVRLLRVAYDQRPVLDALARLPLAPPFCEALQDILRNGQTPQTA